MAVTNLSCRECGTEYELTAQYVCTKCFGPLEVKYDHSAIEGDVASLRRRITSPSLLSRESTTLSPRWAQ